MQVVTWNVNSVRARLERVLEFLQRRRPEVLLLQEIKCLDEQFPREPIEDLGYQVATYGQKTYNGVAILARSRVENVWRGLARGAFATESRVMGAQVGDLLLVNAYVVNGQEVGSEKYAHKLAWFEALRETIAERIDANSKFVLAGDFNVTFDDLDVHDPELWRDKILCSAAERRALQGLIDLGLCDALRRFHPEGRVFTWWDFRTRGFERGLGLRIDHILLNEHALQACSGVEVDLEARGGLKPSDHAPVVAHL